MHFNQLSTIKWHLRGFVSGKTDVEVWNWVIRLFVETISDEIYDVKSRPNLNIQKLLRFDVVELLLHSESHRRLLIPNIIYHCENFNADSRNWITFINNFRKCPSFYCAVYFTRQEKTNGFVLDGIVYLSTVKTIEFETAVFYADTGSSN